MVRSDPTWMAIAAAASVLTGVLTALVVGPLLRRTTSAVDLGTDVPPDYRSLASTRFILGCGLLSTAAALLSWSLLPLAVQPLWTVLASIVVVIVVVDGVTTWMPRRLAHLAWLAMVAAAAGSWILGMTGSALIRAAVGALIAWLLYLVLWLPRGGLGFGDVRLAPLLGAATAALSWTGLLTGLVLGALIGGLYGLFRLVRRQHGPLPYGPSMLLGCYGAALLLPAG